MTRPYTLKRRAVRQEETRRRIVEATVALHEAVGGRAATISAIAERAGVERHTVYRHFPDERALLTACTGHYLALHPPPDPGIWAGVANPAERLRIALPALYAFFAETEGMFARLLTDVEELPVLREVLGPFFGYWEHVRQTLQVGWPDDGEAGRRVRAAIALAVSFPTWRALVREHGLAPHEAAALLLALVTAAAATPDGPSTPP